MKNNYFEKYCEIIHLLMMRDDSENSAIKSVLRFTIREASNHCSDLPGYDNKLGSRFVSEKAFAQIKSGNTTGLVGEHIVPVSVINEMIIKSKKNDISGIQKLISRYSERATITKEEDGKLRQLTLNTKMPEGWDGEDMFARYKKAKIALKDITFKEALRYSKKSNPTP